MFCVKSENTKHSKLLKFTKKNRTNNDIIGKSKIIFNLEENCEKELLL